MEVHHHPDLHHKKKNFKELFIEFIMIFLAVTLGFIAENIRESISNHEQEKHYVESLVNNITEDTIVMHYVLRENIKKEDSLKKLIALANADFSKQANRIKLYTYSTKDIGNYSLFKSNDATMNQLKNSGLQLIKKDHAADSIAGYDVQLKIIDAAEVLYTKATDAALSETQQLLYTATYSDSGNYGSALLPLYEENASSLPRFFNKIDFAIGATQNYISNIQRVLPYSERLLAYLKKEYNLD